MNKYVLMQSKETSQIIIIDNGNPIGRDKVYTFCKDGYINVGTIESELPPITLKLGFTADCRESLKVRERMISKIYDTVDELYAMDDEEFKERYGNE